MDELGPDNNGENPGISSLAMSNEQKGKSSTPMYNIQAQSTNNFQKTGELGMSSQEFWKPTNKDIADLGFEGKKYKTNKIVPAPSSGIGDSNENHSFARVGTAQDRYLYEKEKQRDPAVKMAALHYRKINTLRNEEKDEPFSYFCSPAEVIIDKSNSHPSFRIYYSFVKRFMIVSFILALLANCMIAYNGTSDWFDSKDIKWGTEYINLGNVDGLVYHSEGSYATSVGKDNAEKGRDFMVGIDMTMTLLMILFFMYQIYVSNIEMRSMKSPISVTDFAVKITHLPKECPDDLERDIQSQFLKFGKILEIVPIRNYSKALELELKIRLIGEQIGDVKAKDQIKNTNSQKKIDDLISKEQKLNDTQTKVFQSIKAGHTKEYIVVFETARSKRE